MTSPKELRTLAHTLKDFKLPPRIIEILHKAADDLEQKQMKLDYPDKKDNVK